MSKIFKRPMFRRGGEVGGGIMTGVMREDYEIGGSAKERLLKAFEDYPDKGIDPLYQLAITGGLNLMSQTPTGGLLATASEAFKQPTADLLKNLGAEQRAKREIALAGEQLDIESELALKLAKEKALKESGYLKEESPQRAYEDLVRERTKSAGTLTSFQKPNLEQKFPRTTAEYDSYILRNLRTTENPKGQEIERNNAGFVPFDVKTQTFDYGAMLPNKYYFDPRSIVKSFVIRRVEDNEEKFFSVDPYTFQEVLIEQKR